MELTGKALVKQDEKEAEEAELEAEAAEAAA